MNDEWQVKHTVNWLHECFKGEDSVVPMFFGFSGNKCYLIPIPWNDDNDRIRVLSMLKLFCYCYEIDHYLTVNESWLSHNTKKQPRYSEDRVSCMMLISVNYKRKRMITYKINGDKLERMKQEVGGDIGGDLTKFLAPSDAPKPVEATRAKFKSMFKMNVDPMEIVRGYGENKC